MVYLKFSQLCFFGSLEFLQFLLPCLQKNMKTQRGILRQIAIDKATKKPTQFGKIGTSLSNDLDHLRSMLCEWKGMHAEEQADCHLMLVIHAKL